MQTLWPFVSKNYEIQVKFDFGPESMLEFEISVLLGFYGVWSGCFLPISGQLIGPIPYTEPAHSIPNPNKLFEYHLYYFLI